MWRGDLSPLGCAAAPKATTLILLAHRVAWVGAASRPSGDKSPRHRALFPARQRSVGDAAGTPSPQKLSQPSRHRLIHGKHCGSEPARDSGGSVNEDVGCAGLIASKLAPTGDWVHMNFGSAEDPVWERARDSGTSITQIWIGYRHREQALLPQDKRSPIKNQVGYQAASGMPSLSEAPSGGAKAFCLLLTGPASGLFKSEPPSGRNPKSPLPQQWICTQPHPKNLSEICAKHP